MLIMSKTLGFQKVIFLALFIVILTNSAFSIILLNEKPEKQANYEEIAKSVVNYLNQIIRSGEKPSYVSYKLEHGLLNITVKYKGQFFNIMATKDGRFIFPSFSIPCVIDTSINLSKLFGEKEEVEYNPPKSEKPNVTLFVMSFCPFGNQAENAIEPVIKLLKDKINFEVHYVIYSNYASRLGASWEEYCLDEEEKYCSMHGANELKEDVRELCIQKYHKDILMDYIVKINKKCNVENVETCWKEVADELGINTTKIEECFNEKAFELLEKEVQLNKEYNAYASPMLFINGELYQGERTPNAFKDAICKAFLEPPEECNVMLEENSTKGSMGYC